MIAIYKITSPTNKIYIGQSWDVKTREVERKLGINPGNISSCINHNNKSAGNYKWRLTKQAKLPSVEYHKN